MCSPKHDPKTKSSNSSTSLTSPLSTLSKMRRELNAMSPVDISKWSNFNSWPTSEQKWFREHIPNYELDCLMQLNPFDFSLRDYFWDNPGVLSPRDVTTTTTTTTTTSSLADTSSAHPIRPFSYESIDFGDPPDVDLDWDF